eukprot:comp23379_c0_seq1/m.38698 comp23379_c0_seq1/g.38698  ORF comp23379_c0_seq1/g.38698 comp23379_c0_seq1/m.38698 type:complete len:172 (-) comp23379_c0_seq1:154-669(-)
MGGCCCKPEADDAPNETTRLLKDQLPPQRAANGPSGSGAPREAQPMDESAILQTILDHAANELIDVNRVTSGIQLGKRDYVEREIQYRQTLNQQTNTRGQRPTGRTTLPVLSSATKETDSLVLLLSQSPHLAQNTSLLNYGLDGAVSAVTSITVQPVGEFVVKLEPLHQPS